MMEAIVDTNEFLTSCVVDGSVTAAASLCAAYKQTKSIESSDSRQDALKTLTTERADDEMLWQQVDAQNRQRLKSLRTLLSTSLDLDSLLLRTDQSNGPKENNFEASSSDFVPKAAENQVPQQKSANPPITAANQSASFSRQQPITRKRTKVDDKFFSLSDMNAFCDDLEKGSKQLEKLGDLEDDNDEEMSDDDDDTACDYTYEQFFDPPTTEDAEAQQNIPAADANSDMDSESDVSENETVNEQEHLDHETSVLGEQPETEFTKRQQRLQAKITELEETNLGDKPWQLTGEVGSRDRPQNAMLEEHLQFDRATKLAPIITEDVTARLESLIKQRIRDKAWDDVERKHKPQLQPQKYRNELVLEQQKSKQSLAEIYEQEFQKQTQKQQEDATNPKHDEIRSGMKELFETLDKLTHFHYTPKALSAEVSIINNMRSIEMEEVAPVGTSHEVTIAPEEIKARQTSELKSTEEKTKSDKLRARRKKKIRQKVIADKVGRDKDGLAELAKIGRVRTVKKKKSTESETPDTKRKKSTTSTEFFADLQKQVDSQVRTLKQSTQKSHTAKRRSEQFKL